jgi:hypothetical protein
MEALLDLLEHCPVGMRFQVRHRGRQQAEERKQTLPLHPRADHPLLIIEFNHSDLKH